MGRQKKELLVAVVLTALAIGLGGYAQEISNFGPGATGDSPSFSTVRTAPGAFSNVAIGPSGDDNTGLQFPAADTINIVTGGNTVCQATSTQTLSCNGGVTAAALNTSGNGSVTAGGSGGFLGFFLSLGGTNQPANGWDLKGANNPRLSANTTEVFTCVSSGCTTTGTIVGTGGATFNSISNNTGVYSVGNGSSPAQFGARAANSASAVAHQFYNAVTMTAGTDRYISKWYNDSSLAVPVAQLDTSGQFTGSMGTAVDVTNHLSGVPSVTTTGVGNVGASGPDDLMTYTLPANALVNTNRCVRVSVYGTLANNANAKTVSLVWGSQTLLTKQMSISLAGDTWAGNFTCCRTGASTQDCYAELFNNGATTLSLTDGPTVFKEEAFVAGTQTETSTIVIKAQSTVSTSNNDIVQEGMIVEYL